MELIDRKALIAHLNECIVSHGIAHSPLIDAVLTAVKCAVEQMPTVEPKRGEWLEYKDEFTHCHQCSICGGDAMGEGDENGMFFEVLTDKCPHCGASMRGEKHETRADE